jgi:cytochrome c oxidase cbb3-type subunit 3
MSRPEKDRILEHDYDGIREYDNPLPGWWVLVFYVCVAWAAGYAAWSFGSAGQKSRQADFAALDSRLQQKMAAATPVDDATVEASLRAIAKDPSRIAQGKELFATRCMPCHGASGEGIVGPNLTDDFVLHGWRLADMHRVVTDGVPEKGMIPWKTMLTPDQIAIVTVYAATLRGTSPPNPKPPQGDPAGGRPIPTG